MDQAVRDFSAALFLAPMRAAQAEAGNNGKNER